MYSNATQVRPSEVGLTGIRTLDTSGTGHRWESSQHSPYLQPPTSFGSEPPPQQPLLMVGFKPTGPIAVNWARHLSGPDLYIICDRLYLYLISSDVRGSPKRRPTESPKAYPDWTRSLPALLFHPFLSGCLVTKS